MREAEPADSVTDADGRPPGRDGASTPTGGDGSGGGAGLSEPPDGGQIGVDAGKSDPVSEIAESFVALLFPYRVSESALAAHRARASAFLAEHGYDGELGLEELWQDRLSPSADPMVRAVTSRIEAEMAAVPAGEYAKPADQDALQTGKPLPAVLFLVHLPQRADGIDYQVAVREHISQASELDGVPRLLIANPLPFGAEQGYPVVDRALAVEQSTRIEWDHHGGYSAQVSAGTAHIIGKYFGDCVGTTGLSFLRYFKSAQLSESEIVFHLRWISPQHRDDLRSGAKTAGDLLAEVRDQTNLGTALEGAALQETTTVELASGDRELRYDFLVDGKEFGLVFRY